MPRPKVKVVRVPQRFLRTGARRRARAIKRMARRGYRLTETLRSGTELVFTREPEK